MLVGVSLDFRFWYSVLCWVLILKCLCSVVSMWVMLVLFMGILWFGSMCMVLILFSECWFFGLKVWIELMFLFSSFICSGLLVFIGNMLSRLLCMVKLFGFIICGMLW